MLNRFPNRVLVYCVLRRSCATFPGVKLFQCVCAVRFNTVARARNGSALCESNRAEICSYLNVDVIAKGHLILTEVNKYVHRTSCLHAFDTFT